MKKTPLTYARELHDALIEADDGEARSLIRTFLASLARTRKSQLKPRILAAFKWIALAAEGRRAGRVVTARPLTPETRTKIAKAFKNVVFEEAVDPKLMGGAVVEIEDLRIDGSIRSKLDALKQKIAYEA